MESTASSLEIMRMLVAASRASSAAVLDALMRAIAVQEPAFDALLAFAPDGAEFRCVGGCGARAEHYAGLRLRRDATDVLPAVAARAGHRVCATSPALIPTDRFAVAVPLIDGSGVHAVLYASSTRPRVDVEETVRTIDLATLPYTIALERESDRADATYDGLTGLLTPRAFRNRLAAELSGAQARAGRLLTLWFVDTDHFKVVNDRHGHAAGDLVLQRMAQLLRLAVIPEVDEIARNGGDEFCALVFDAPKAVAIERAAAFCAAVRGHDFGVPVRITASVGVATFPYDAGTSNALLEVADAAMYHSKREGRDRVSFACDGGNFSVFRA